jgi:purine-binding chemotaxis protein CheW
MAVETDTNQFLTFTLDEEQYAADVGKVREVLELLPMTKLPRMPDYMKGVINIRGSVVPVVDLRRKFGMSEVSETVDTSIIVMDVGEGEKNLTVGCLADSVEEVINILPEDVEPAPSFGTAVDTEFIEGIAKREEQFIILLDIDRVFEESELELIQRESDR